MQPQPGARTSAATSGGAPVAHEPADRQPHLGEHMPVPARRPDRRRSRPAGRRDRHVGRAGLVECADDHAVVRIVGHRRGDRAVGRARTRGRSRARSGRCGDAARPLRSGPPAAAGSVTSSTRSRWSAMRDSMPITRARPPAGGSAIEGCRRPAGLARCTESRIQSGARDGGHGAWHDGAVHGDQLAGLPDREPARSSPGCRSTARQPGSRGRASPGDRSGGTRPGCSWPARGRLRCAPRRPPQAGRSR